MSKVVLYDTETSGLPLWKEPSNDPRQPHICQFTAVLFDDQTHDELEYVNLIVRQEGWTVDPEAFATHKITPEQSMLEGEPEHHAVQYFEALIEEADIVAGFNVTFDNRIMRIAMLRAGRAKGYCDLIGQRVQAKMYDVMQKCRPLCKLPPTDKMMAAGRYTSKPPSLEEAYEIIIGGPMPDAHDARGDILATMELYKHLTKGAR